MQKPSFCHHANFLLLPEAQQKKLHNFFMRPAHYMVEDEDIEHFLDSGKAFEVTDCIDELFRTCQQDGVKAVLAHKQPWDDHESMLKWLSLLAKLPNHIMLTTVTRSYTGEEDLADEWYIISS